MTELKIALACAIVLVSLWVQGFTRTLIVALLGSVLFFVVPFTVFGDPSIVTWGISSGAIGIRAYTVVIVGALAALALYKKVRSVPWLFVPFLAFAGAMTLTVWGGTVQQWSGYLLVVTALLAWMLGTAGGQRIRRESGNGKFLLFAVSAVVVAEAIISVLQIAGLEIFPLSGRTGALMETRANGTFFHPNKLGQVLVPLMVLVLPFIRSSVKSLQRIAVCTMVAGLVAVVLSASRANSVALVLMIVTWAVLSRKDLPFLRAQRLPRFLIPTFTVLAALGVAGVFIARFIQNGFEDSRGDLVQVALQQIARTPWQGIGLNSYVDVVGQFDELTSLGWPVHNIFLHMAVETGIIGALLFFAPIFWTFILAYRLRTLPGSRGDFAKAYCSFLPALLVIGSLDWGMLADYVLVVWFIVAAFCVAKFNQAETPASPTPSETSRFRERLLR